MNINGTSNRAPIRTTRSKSSCAKMADSVSARDGKQNNFGEVLKQSESARDTFNSISSANHIREKVTVSSVPFTQAKLDSISEAIKNADYSEMSKAEIYADIEKKYADSFDDFYMTAAVQPSEDHIMIRQQFQEDIHNNLGYTIGCTPRSIVFEAKGYSNMSYDEIEAAIKEKYAGKTGFIDQLNLVGELFSSGVLSNKLGHEEAFYMVCNLETSIECGYDGRISKSEWLDKIEETGVSSPFSLLLNSPYFAEYKEKYQAIADDILFGIADDTQ